jgi:hypothetical protein
MADRLRSCPSATIPALMAIEELSADKCREVTCHDACDLGHELRGSGMRWS